MKKLLFLLVIGMVVVLAACSGSGTAAATNAGGTAVTRLNAAYQDALPVQSQLAVGTLQLENGDLAVDETLAAELLPLWRAVQSLANSDTAAEAEVTAVLNQIQDAMTPEQIAAIAAMQLTQESAQTLMADGVLALGGFGGNRGGAAGSTNSALSGLASGAAGPGGGPGGMPGGGAGGGMPTGGDPGMMGGEFAGDPAALATRAGAAAGGDFLVLGMTSAVIRLLETKSGDVTMPAGFGPFDSVITAVAAATGLSEDDVRAAAQEQTFAEIIATNGGDVTAVTAGLVESLQDSAMLQGQDPEAFVTGLLHGSMNGRPENQQP